MKEFADAALPWIVLGLAIAVVASTYSRNGARQKRKKGPALSVGLHKPGAVGERKNGYLTLGLCLGLCIGTLLSLYGAVSLPYGISYGLLFGVTAAVCMKR